MDNKPSIIKPESNLDETHTYPPRPVQKDKRTIWLPGLSDTPLARGYYEDLDTSKPPVDNLSSSSSSNTNSGTNSPINKVQLSAHFLDEQNKNK